MYVRITCKLLYPDDLDVCVVIVEFIFRTVALFNFHLSEKWNYSNLCFKKKKQLAFTSLLLAHLFYTFLMRVNKQVDTVKPSGVITT